MTGPFAPYRAHGVRFKTTRQEFEQLERDADQVRRSDQVRVSVEALRHLLMDHAALAAALGMDG